MDEYTIVKYNFLTSSGPGSVTVAVSKAEAIDEVGEGLVESFKSHYNEVELTGHEIVQKN